MLDWEAVLADDASDFQVPIALTDLADIMYTSGTTGLPKGIAVRHDNVAMIPNNEPNWTGGGWLHGAPMFTFAGIAFIYNPMKMGLTAYYQPKFDAGRWLEYVATERPTHTMLVPSFAELLVAHPEFATADLSSLVQVSIGSAPIAPHTHRTLIERLPERERRQLVRHERSRPRVHHHAEGRDRTTRRFGREAGRSDGDPDRR